MKLKRYFTCDLMIATAALIISLIIDAEAQPNSIRRSNNNIRTISTRPREDLVARSSSPMSSSFDPPSQVTLNSNSDSSPTAPSSSSSPSFLHDRTNLDNFDRDNNSNQDILSPVGTGDEIASGLTASSTNEEDSNDNLETEHDEAVDNSHEVPDRNILLDNHNSRLQAMHDMFERRQLNNHQLQSSQELNPITIGLDPVSGPGSPFNLPPFPVPNHDGPPHSKPALANNDNLDQALGPSLPFGLNPLPHLLGFQSPAFDGPQRGDQSAHSNHHTSMSSSDADGTSTGGSRKVYEKIFRFTDGRINLSDFEKQKKIRLSNKNQHGSENHIESAPIMFDGRQLKRKSFLILHGGVFSR